jgi:hypothetical protein
VLRPESTGVSINARDGDMADNVKRKTLSKQPARLNLDVAGSPRRAHPRTGAQPGSPRVNARVADGAPAASSTTSSSASWTPMWALPDPAEHDEKCLVLVKEMNEVCAEADRLVLAAVSTSTGDALVVEASVLMSELLRYVESARESLGSDISKARDHLWKARGVGRDLGEIFKGVASDDSTTSRSDTSLLEKRLRTIRANVAALFDTLGESWVEEIPVSLRISQIPQWKTPQSREGVTTSSASSSSAVTDRLQASGSLPTGTPGRLLVDGTKRLDTSFIQRAQGEELYRRPVVMRLHWPAWMVQVVKAHGEDALPEDLRKGFDSLIDSWLKMEREASHLDDVFSRHKDAMPEAMIKQLVDPAYALRRALQQWPEGREKALSQMRIARFAMQDCLAVEDRKASQEEGAESGSGTELGEAVSLSLGQTIANQLREKMSCWAEELGKAIAVLENAEDAVPRLMATAPGTPAAIVELAGRTGAKLKRALTKRREVSQAVLSVVKSLADNLNALKGDVDALDDPAAGEALSACLQSMAACLAAREASDMETAMLRANLDFQTVYDKLSKAWASPGADIGAQSLRSKAQMLNLIKMSFKPAIESVMHGSTEGKAQLQAQSSPRPLHGRKTRNEESQAKTPRLKEAPNSDKDS